MGKIKLIFIVCSIVLNAQTEQRNTEIIMELEKFGDSLFKSSNFSEAALTYKKLVQINPSSFDFNFKYASAFGLEVEAMPRFKQAKNAREMVKLFEKAYLLNSKDIALNRALLEIYLKVPRFFGGGNKKARAIIKNIFSISEEEGNKAQEFYNNF